jgi:dTMP kinase
VTAANDLRGVLRIPAFRKLWIALSLSSFGDWLGLLALTALASNLASNGYAAANLAIAGVFILRLAPAIFIGPFGGVIADRLDRRWTMVICDVTRFALFASIPIVGTLWWLLVATFLIEAASLVWIPAKEATVPNLVPRERLATANQLSLLTTYGSAPVAALVFSGLALFTGIIDNAAPGINEIDVALWVNAVTFLVSALTILQLKEIPPRVHEARGAGTAPSVWRTLVEGWSFVGRTPMVRGLVAGILGAFAAGGAVIGLARTFVGDLGAGEPGYGLLFGTVFCGLALGMFLGPRILPQFSRRRLLGLAITAAGLCLALLALIPNMVIAVLLTLVLGAWAGTAWVTGYTLLGLEVADELRGRTFAFVQTMVRVTLVLVLVVAPLLAAAFGRHHIRLTDTMTLTYNGAAITMLLAGLLAAALGLASFRQMDDRRGVSLVQDIVAAYRSEPIAFGHTEANAGFFIALEGGEGAGKTTQSRLLAEWLRDKDHEVVTTFEPGGTEVGERLRAVLLEASADHPALSPRAEALLFAADRAEHVATVINPALSRGAIVITDRYIDSSVAYQGAGRDLDAADIARLSRWATDGLRPDLTVLLDLPAADGLSRVETPDRLESEPLDFHERVRERYLDIARRGGSAYLVVDATQQPERVAAEVKARLESLLPLSPREREEREAARLAEEERLRVEAEERARREALEAEERARREALEAEERARREAERQAAEAARREAAEQQRREQEAERARQRAEAAEAKAREKAAAAEAKAAAAAEKARRDKLEADVRRARAERESAEGQTAVERRAAEETQRIPRVEDPPTGDGDPPTRRLSLSDELLGGPTEDETIQLPKIRDDR